jgi:hypothetical protein
LVIRGRQEKHPGAFDQRPIFWGEPRMNLNFIESVRNAPRVKLILEPPRAFVIEARVGGPRRKRNLLAHTHLKWW